MQDDEIKAIREWLNDDERKLSYSHTEEDDSEDVMFVDANDFVSFGDYLRENFPDLICIDGKIGCDGIWFSSQDLENARFY